MSGSIQKSLSVYVEICNTCNLKCLHCYNSSKPSCSESMSLENFKHIVRELIANKASQLSVSGGEALLHPQINDILDFLANCKELSSVEIVTNGILVIDKLDKYLSPNSIFSIQISLDGGTEEVNDKIRGKGHFKKVTALLEHLTSKGFKRVKTKMTINAINYVDVGAFIELSYKHNAIPNLAFINRIGRGDENWTELGLSDIEKVKIRKETFNILQLYDVEDINKILQPSTDCPLSNGSDLASPLIKLDGTVQPCQVIYNDLYSIGNIFHKPLEEIISYEKNEALGAIKELFNARKALLMANDPSCKKCFLAKVCNLGCPGFALCENDNILSSDGLCQGRKSFYLSSYLKNTAAKS